MNITWSLPGHSRCGQIDDAVLKTPLPADRAYGEAGLCYGHYVRAVEAVLEKEAQGTGKGLARALFPDAPCRLLSAHVEILKHGHFYHPARMTLKTDAGTIPLVINLAVTPEGNACAEGEFTLLEALGHKSTTLPRVYALDAVSVDEHRVVLFFGEWFEGFHEFHQTEKDGENRVVVWAGQDHHHLSRSREISVYRQAAGILTRLYNPLTFELVQPWHHAAGDFVVNIKEDDPKVRLITVRQYTPMAEVQEPEAEEIMEGALYFLMLLTLRNRLDRYDGIGEVAWVGDHCVGASLDGFFDGVADLVDVGPLDGPFGVWVARYLAMHSQEDFLETARGVVSSFNPGASEMGVVAGKVAEHAASFYRAVQARSPAHEIK
ncbi:hypothetical protein [Desulfoluna spongiiphila]|uniref:Uncharacterized protein n=1 Tax=Desulfoluna spongiiphila TaxID=419481 RepID=A0A1G5J6C7_9BACT|nr:hypothetical protein [Desulfoluna spongiiphila]SCY83500.1 hypothetical protein SAMN05216233_12531 [Desulfoluna spongiiphila]